jgi:Matrixin
MLRPLITFIALALALLAMVPLANATGEKAPNAVSALGIARAGGEDVFVEVLVAVPEGADAHAAAAQALREQGARPADREELESAAFTMTGLVWDNFSDGNAANDFVTQNYNPKGDPTGGAALTALLNSHATWTDVPSSSFAFGYGGTSNRCPSLVNECPGPQTYDDRNDVAWVKLSGCCTLAVTWFSTSRDETDMGINTRFKWSTGVSTPAGRYDLESVLLHENGHVAGLGHSADTSAVMYAYYGGLRRELHQDDVDGISFLYP